MAPDLVAELIAEPPRATRESEHAHRAAECGMGAEPRAWGPSVTRASADLRAVVRARDAHARHSDGARSPTYRRTGSPDRTISAAARSLDFGAVAISALACTEVPDRPSTRSSLAGALQ